MEWEARNLNSEAGIILPEEMQGKILFNISFSRHFAKKGNSMIGRKEDGIPGGLFGFGTRIIVANFLSIGKYDNLREASK